MNFEKAKTDLSIKPPKKSAFTISTPPDYFKMNMLLIASGKKGGGKSVGVCNYIKRLLTNNIIDDTIIISPTYYSNKEIYDMIVVNDKPNVLDPLDDNVIQQAIELVKSKKDAYEEYLGKLELYKQFKKDIAGRKYTLDELHDIYEEDIWEFIESPPEYEYKNKRPPRFYIVLDDILGTKLMSSSTRGLTWLAIRMRHVCEGLGISMAILTQSYASQNGLPRVIRENTNVLMLFSNTDTKQLEKIHQENFNEREISFDTFMEVFEYCVREPYNFMLIDFSPKDKSKFIRKNFDEYIILKDFKK